MTISTTVNKNSFNGNDSATTFDTTFKFFDSTELTVILTDTGDLDTTLVESTDYTVSGGDGSTGTITYPVSGDPLATGEVLTVIRDVPTTQDLDLLNGGAWNPEEVEKALDRLTMIVQQLEELLDRSVVAAPSDVAPNMVLPNAATRANGFLGFDANGDASVVTDVLPSEVTTTPFGESLVNSANAASALTTLGASAFGQTWIGLANSAAGASNLNAAVLTSNTFTGVQRWSKGANVAVAAALAPGTDGNLFNLTGSGTITSINSLGVGTTIRLIVAAGGAPTFQHNATDLIIPGGVDLVADAGDVIELAEYASGDWVLVSFTDASQALPYVGGIPSGAGQYFKTPAQSIASYGLSTIAHGLGVLPRLGNAFVKCKVNHVGYLVGEEVHNPAAAVTVTAGTFFYGVSIAWDDTNVYLSQSLSFWIIRRDNGAPIQVPAANWDLYGQVWA